MPDDIQIWLTYGAAFIAAAAITLLAGEVFLKRHRLSTRLASDTSVDGDTGGAGGGVFRGLATKLLSVNDRLVGLDDAGLKSKARYQLIRAGFFSPNAAKVFLVVQASLTALMPVLGYVFLAAFAGKMKIEHQLALNLLLLGIGYFGPDIYVKHREKNLLEQYRTVFPDMLDLLIVCLDAGSSVNMALERVGRDIAFESKALSTNIKLLVSEMQAGRSLVDALDSFTKRVALEEAKSLAVLIRQSTDLGTDVGEALRVYADEMREKRTSRAEAKANELPVKMVLPLGLFIFPAILIVVITPVMLKLMSAFHHITTHVAH